MPATFTPGISNLGDAEERMRRSFNLVGLINSEFAPTILPIMIVDDATRPGANVWRGRAFAGAQSFNLPVSAGDRATVAIKCSVAVWIERVTLAWTADDPGGLLSGVIWSLQLAGAATADPFAIASPGSHLIENFSSVTEYAPILSGTTTTTYLAANGIFKNATTRNATTLEIPLRVALLPGAKFGVTGAAIHTTAIIPAALVSWSGRIF